MKKKHNKLYLKMYINAGKGVSRETIFRRFTHIGQVRLFDYIIVNCNKETLRWNIDKKSREEILKDLEIGDSTLNRYLADMSNEKIGALKRLSKGSYEINSEFLDSNINKEKQ